MAAWAEKLRKAKFINMWGELLQKKQSTHFPVVVKLERNPTQEAKFSGFDLFFAEFVGDMNPTGVTRRHDALLDWQKKPREYQEIFEIWATGFNSYWREWKARAKNFYEWQTLLRNEGYFDALGNLKMRHNGGGARGSERAHTVPREPSSI
ncbi:hypothetical protein L208DRAFT_1376509 [Tricholoma matsutake]|nr:hypothetical protein L208DRAFT_1376509 [Tricholoma matsutake 945]